MIFSESMYCIVLLHWVVCEFWGGALQNVFCERTPSACSFSRSRRIPGCALTLQCLSWKNHSLVRKNAMNAFTFYDRESHTFLSWNRISNDLVSPSRSRCCDEVLWADDGVRLRRALNGLLERAYAKRQACLYHT